MTPCHMSLCVELVRQLLKPGWPKARLPCGQTLGHMVALEQLLWVEKVLRSSTAQEVLGLPVSRPLDCIEIRKAYKMWALRVHPDKNSCPGSSEAFRMVTLAQATLQSRAAQDPATPQAAWRAQADADWASCEAARKDLNSRLRAEAHQQWERAEAARKVHKVQLQHAADMAWKNANALRKAEISQRQRWAEQRWDQDLKAMMSQDEVLRSEITKDWQRDMWFARNSYEVCCARRRWYLSQADRKEKWRQLWSEAKWRWFQAEAEWTALDSSLARKMDEAFRVAQAFCKAENQRLLSEMSRSWDAAIAAQKAENTRRLNEANARWESWRKSGHC